MFSIRRELKARRVYDSAYMESIAPINPEETSALARQKEYSGEIQETVAVERLKFMLVWGTDEGTRKRAGSLCGTSRKMWGEVELRRLGNID